MLTIEEAFSTVRDAAEQEWRARGPERPTASVSVVLPIPEGVFEMAPGRLCDALISALEALPCVQSARPYEDALVMIGDDIAFAVPCIRVVCHPYANRASPRNSIPAMGG